MSVCAERRITMDSQFISPISVEKFAAYLDGNLPESEMQEIESVISQNDNLEDLVLMSDIIDEDTQIYLQDDFAYNADMSMLEESDFEVPQLDVAGEKLPLVACAAMDSDNGYDDILDVAADSEKIEAELPIDIPEEHNVIDFEEMNFEQENIQNDDAIINENHMDLQDMNLFSPFE